MLNALDIGIINSHDPLKSGLLKVLVNHFQIISLFFYMKIDFPLSF